MKTHQFLYLSLGLNAVLVGACGYLLSAPSSNPGLLPNERHVQASAQVATAPMPPASRATPAPAAFHWRQIESEDFSTYIANLRSIGVPEPTLRDIVSAEVAEQYQEKRQAIQARPTSTEASRREKQQLLDHLPQIQETVVSGLLSAGNPVALSNSRVPLVAGSSATPPEQRISPAASAARAITTSEADVPALLPAVLVASDPAIPLSELQVAEWLKLEQDFVDRIGGPNQNPSDPAYRTRWQSAQKSSNSMFRAKFGTAAFLQQNIEAGRRSGEQ